MTSLNALEKIKSIYLLKYDAAIAKVALLEKEYSEAKYQLDEILSYYNEYCDFFIKQSGQGLKGYQFKNQYSFIGKFSPVISQQNVIIEQLHQKILLAKDTLFCCYKDLKGLEQLLDKKKMLLANLKNKEEVASQQETFVNIHINKNLN